MLELIVSDLRIMAGIIWEMIELVYKGFTLNDSRPLDKAMDRERVMDEVERKITAMVVKSVKSLSEEEQVKYLTYMQTAQNIERMGDELRSLIERIEIKISECLYFSEEAADQYLQLFEKMRRSVYLIVNYLNEEDPKLLDEIIGNGSEVKTCVETARTSHVKRLAKGVCEPRVSNIFFDMLDFTGNVARHCTYIARISKEIPHGI